MGSLTIEHALTDVRCEVKMYVDLLLQTKSRASVLAHKLQWWPVII